MNPLPLSSRSRLASARTTLSSLLPSHWSDPLNLQTVPFDDSSFDGIYNLAFVTGGEGVGEELLLTCSEDNEVFLSSLREDNSDSDGKEATRSIGKIPSFSYCDCAALTNFGRRAVCGSRTEGGMHLFAFERSSSSTDDGGNNNTTGYTEIPVSDTNSGGQDFVWSVNRDHGGGGNGPLAVSFQQRREGTNAWFYDPRSKSSYRHSLPGSESTTTLFGASFLSGDTLLTSHANAAKGTSSFRYWDVRNMKEST